MGIKTFWNKYKNIFIKAICYIVIFCVLMISFNFSFHNLFRNESSLVNAQTNDELMSVTTNDSYEIIGETNRTLPSTTGLYETSDYPSSLNIITDVDTQKRTNIYNENIAIYDDIENAINENRLSKHKSADGQFWGTVSDNAPGIIKKTYVNSSVKGKHSLGVYAPAGEILTIEISEEMINKGLSVTIGYEISQNQIPLDTFLTGKIDRMPLISKSFNLTSTSTKIGTPLGGAVTINIPNNVTKDFTVTVSGGVDNPVFQLGVNTLEDLKEMEKAPGLIMEYKLPHIRLVMPKSYASYNENTIKALELWHKMTSLSSYAMNREANTLPISHYHDSYIPAGAAVAYVNAWFSILPLSWGTDALNYNSLMQSGSWGNFHEYNHHFQSPNYNTMGYWGLESPIEVTNNVLTTLGYILYTDIATTRSETQQPGNGGWNVSTDPYYNLKRVLEVSNESTSFNDWGTNQLYMYAELMHAFGADNFLNFIHSSYGLYGEYSKNLLSSVDDFALRASEVFKSNLTYFFTTICKMNLKEQTITAIKNLEYEPYLPLHNLYSNGIQNINTGRTYLLNTNKYLFDFNKYTISPLEFTIKEVSKPLYGKLKRNNDGTYTYTNNNYKKDSFSITYKINYEDKEYLKTLDFVIDFSLNKTELKTYNTSHTEMNAALNDLKEENLLQKSYLDGINYNTINGNNLSVAKGKIKVEKTGNYTFIVYGDDKVKLTLNGQEASTNAYQATIDTSKEQTFFTTYLEKDKFYDYTLYCLNTGGEGSAKVKYSYENENNFQNINDNYIYSTGADDNNTKPKTTNYPLKYSITNSLVNLKYHSNTLNKIESIETNANSNNQTIPSNMYDGDRSTYYHTAWQNNITEFPHEYILTFTKQASFNYLNIAFWRDDLTYAIGNYEIYISDDNNEYKLIKEGSNEQTSLKINFDQEYNAKYLKLVVKSNADNQKFTAISEIEVGIETNANNLTYYSTKNNKLHYRGNWELETINNHFNGVSSKTNTKSRMEFSFEGTKLLLYTKEGSHFKIKIDGNKWKTIKNDGSTNYPSYISINLKDKEHKIVIENLEETSIEMIAVEGKLLARNIYSLSFLEFYKIIASIFLTFILIQGTLFLINKRMIFTSKIKKLINNIKEKI